MDLHAQMRLRTEQRLALLPKMLQSIEVLQLGTAELQEWIEREAERNETLDVRPAEHHAPLPRDARTEHRDPNGEHAFDGERWRRPRNASGDEVDGKQLLLENVAANGGGLLEAIRLQLAWAEVPAPLAAKVLALAERLDERGLLPAVREELAAALGEELLDEALAVLRALEPKGLGARTPIEAMLLQVGSDDPDFETMRVLLTEHLAALSRNKIPQVARAVGVTIEHLHGLLERMRRLQPRPAAAFATPEDAGPLRPEVDVRLVDDRIVVLVEDTDLPSLGINEDYAAMAQDRGTARDVRRYLRGKLHAARDLIHALDQRRRTLGRVARAVMEHQREFLARGRAAIRPLRMADLAERLGLHVSTISRAIAGKYVQTDWGILRLRDFFDGGAAARESGRGAHTPGSDRRSPRPLAATAAGPASVAGAAIGAAAAAPTAAARVADPADPVSTGVGAGRMGIKEAIRLLVEQEDPSAPLSDDQLVARLAERGITVARRTVTKYRLELQLPSSWLRRRYER